MALDKIKDRIRALQAMTTARGCTEAEAMAAAEKAAELLRRHGLTDSDIEMTTATAPQKTRRATQRDYLWGTIARCTNTAAVFHFQGGQYLIMFIGREPGPEIAAYLKTVCDRAIDSAIAEFKRSAFYRRRRSLSTKRQAVAEFTVAMITRLQHRLQELFIDITSDGALEAAKRHLAVLHPDCKERAAPAEIAERFHDAQAAGWAAGARVGLRHGMTGGKSAPLSLADPYRE